jgi:putative two-component system response regulator
VVSETAPSRTVPGVEGDTVPRQLVETVKHAPAREVPSVPWHPTIQPSILIVDHQDINRRLLRAMLKHEPYRILEARRADEALSVLIAENVDLVILDLMLPEMSGLDLCRRIKADRQTQLVPVLIMTSVQGVENEIASITSGADEFLTKPLHHAVVRTRIRALLRNKAAIDSLEEAETILFALAQAIEQRDTYTSGHCERLARYAVMLGNALGLSHAELLTLHRGGYLHDIGKVGIPDSILFKRGSLTEDEWVLMRSHTTKGEEICRPMKSLAPVLPIIRNHHERWNGTGYPDGLRGEEIPLLARVLQISDIYDALITQRSYKPALSPEEALNVMEDEVERGWRDPELVALFRELCLSPRQNEFADVLLESAENGSLQRSLENMRRGLAE